MGDLEEDDDDDEDEEGLEGEDVEAVAVWDASFAAGRGFGVLFARMSFTLFFNLPSAILFCLSSLTSFSPCLYHHHHHQLFPAMTASR
jgi:hypothetical protein